MSSRFFAATVMVFSAMLLLIGCGASDESILTAPCQDQCPGDLVAVERCPAFLSCEKFNGCDDRPLICAPEQDGNGDDGIGGGHSPDCNQPASCPEHMKKVASCPDGQLCTRITHCDTSLLCMELPDACQEEPLCPGDDRAIEGHQCDEAFGSTCYRRMHCSGPVLCLICAELPQSCPEDLISVDAEECEESDEPCLVVETCKETLFCAKESEAPRDPPIQCDPELQCPDDSVERDDCKVDDPQCFTIRGCDGPLQCGAPPAEDGCQDKPICPETHVVTPLDKCASNHEGCLFIADCGELIACLPAAR